MQLPPNVWRLYCYARAYFVYDILSVRVWGMTMMRYTTHNTCEVNMRWECTQSFHPSIHPCDDAHKRNADCKARRTPRHGFHTIETEIRIPFNTGIQQTPHTHTNTLNVCIHFILVGRFASNRRNVKPYEPVRSSFVAQHKNTCTQHSQYLTAHIHTQHTHRHSIRMRIGTGKLLCIYYYCCIPAGHTCTECDTQHTRTQRIPLQFGYNTAAQYMQTYICFVFNEASAVSRHPLLIQSFVESLLGK